jgi:hypothetical protein
VPGHGGFQRRDFKNLAQLADQGNLVGSQAKT